MGSTPTTVAIVPDAQRTGARPRSEFVQVRLLPGTPTPLTFGRGALSCYIRVMPTHAEYMRSRYADDPETRRKHKIRVRSSNQSVIAVRPKACPRCSGPKPQAHHPNYDKPDDIAWLCRPCHLREHYGPELVELVCIICHRDFVRPRKAARSAVRRGSRPCCSYICSGVASRGGMSVS